MGSVLFAEFAVFLHFKSFCIVFLVFKRIVISLFAFCTSESYLCSCAFCSHNTPSESQKINTPNPKCYVIVSNLIFYVKVFSGFLNKISAIYIIYYIVPIFRQNPPYPPQNVGDIGAYK